MNANYAIICRVGILEADVKQVLPVHFVLKSSQYFNNSNSAKKRKNISLDKNSKNKSLYYRNWIGQTNFSRKLNAKQKTSFRVMSKGQ